MRASLARRRTWSTTSSTKSERELPRRDRGYYREYTVDTPGSRDRGARRIVTGGSPPSEYWYTEDHYRSFRRIDGAAGQAQ